MWITCLFGFHRRSRGAAHYEGPRFVSICARCGVPMEKNEVGRWIVRRPTRPEARAGVAEGPSKRNVLFTVSVELRTGVKEASAIGPRRALAQMRKFRELYGIEPVVANGGETCTEGDLERWSEAPGG